MRRDASDTSQKAVSRQHPVLLQQRCLLGSASFRRVLNPNEPTRGRWPGNRSEDSRTGRSEKG